MNLLLCSLFFSSIGFGYFIYGKKQQKFVPLIVGLGLCVFPYFIDNIYAMVILGTILILVPWIWKED